MIALDFYTYFFINIVSLSYNVALATVLAILYAILFAILIYLAAIATKIDPTDPTIYAEREAQTKG